MVTTQLTSRHHQGNKEEFVVESRKTGTEQNETTLIDLQFVLCTVLTFYYSGVLLLLSSHVTFTTEYWSLIVTTGGLAVVFEILESVTTEV